MNTFKSHFWYNKSQRNGIFFLALIIITLQLVFFFVDFSTKDKTDLNSEELLHFQKHIDSLKAIELATVKPKIFPFNPSFISDFKGYQLGMSIQEIDRLLAYRASGKYINSVEEFQQVTQVSDSLLNIISPYFKFPEWVTNKQAKTPINNTSSKNKKLTTYKVQDLNSVSAQELIKVNGIGEKLAQRIISYRTKLGGFILDEQLYEVYYLDKSVANTVLEQFKVLKRPSIQKINVNEASFKEILSILYIDYELTKKIFDYKEEVAEIQSLEELKKIEGFPIEKFDRIALYLSVK